MASKEPKRPEIHRKRSQGIFNIFENITKKGAPSKATVTEEEKIDIVVRNSDIRNSEVKAEFTPSHGLTSSEAEALLAKWGRNELIEKSKTKLRIFIEQFTAPMPIMIWIAIIIEAALNNWPDMGVLIALQAMNGGIGFYETIKAGNAVAALKASLKPKAYAKRDGKFIEINGALLVPGDLVILGAGAAVPADCIVNEGTIDVDQAALTGESLPVTMVKGDSAKMGSTVCRGETEATVSETGMNTFFGKTASMIQSVEGLGHLQKILLTIMAFLIILSLVLCGSCLGYLLGSGEDINQALSFMVAVLVSSIPIAMEIVVTATMALGSRELAKMDAIVARLTAIEELAGMNILCSDKTGTLTLNKMVIQDDCPVFVEGIGYEDVLLHAALAAKWREPPKDALDTMVLGAADLDLCDAYKQTDYVPFDPTKKRTEASLEDAAGKPFKVTKGAPHIVLELCKNKSGIQEEIDSKVLNLAERGIRSLAVARTDENGEYFMMGILTFLDPPRPDTKHTIEQARVYGVEVKMVTGDHRAIAIETARVLEMGTNILGCDGLPSLGPNGEIPDDMGDLGQRILECNGFSQVFPEHKFLIVEALRRNGFAVGMTGDGVNDAPALKKADVGIAVQGATDAARAAADIILTSPGLSVVVDAIIISRKIFARMKTFIVYRVACTLQLVVFFFIAVFALRPVHYVADFPQFWYMPIISLIIITVLNDGSIISIAYDNVQSSKNPEIWNLPSIFIVSSLLGAVALVSSLILLDAALSSHKDNNIFGYFNIRLDFPQVMSALYLKVSLSDFLTLFASRTHGLFFVQRPGKLLAAAFVIAVGLSTIFSCTWPFGDGMHEMPGRAAGLVWAYCIAWFWVQDIGKTVLYWFMHKYNILGINNSKSIVANEHRGAFKDGDADPKKQRNEVDRNRVTNQLVDIVIDAGSFGKHEGNFGIMGQ
jgi:H+-transporting ATPase